MNFKCFFVKSKVTKGKSQQNFTLDKARNIKIENID